MSYAKIFRRTVITFMFVVLAAAARADGPARTTIMAVGDSITQGGEGFESYTAPLWSMLYGAGYAFDFIGPNSFTCRSVRSACTRMCPSAHSTVSCGAAATASTPSGR